MKNLFIFISLLLQFTVTAAQTSSLQNSEDSIAHDRSFDYFYLQALSMVNAEDYASAIDLYQHCLSKDPNSAVVKFELSAIYYALGRKDEAVKMLQEAVAAQPDNFWYHNSLAARYNDQGNVDKAIECLLYIAENFPDESSIYLSLADIYIENMDYENAYNVLSEYDKKEGRSYEITYQKVLLLLRLMKNDEAIAEVKSLIKEIPEDPRSQMLLAEIYYTLDEKDKSLLVYEDMLEDDSTNVDVLKSVAYHYSNLNTSEGDSIASLYVDKLLHNDKLDPQERGDMLSMHTLRLTAKEGADFAIKYLEELMQYPYGQVQTGECLAVYLQHLGYSEERVSPVLQQILQLEPDNVYAHYELAKYSAEREDNAQLLNRCDTALLYNPKEAVFYYFKAVALYNLDSLQLSAETFFLGAEKCKEDTDVELISTLYGHAGDIYHTLGNEQLSMELYDSALLYNEYNIEVLNNYAYHLSVVGKNLPKALEMSQKCIEEEPDNLTYIDTYAWILFKMERYEEAKAYAELMLSLSEELDSEVLYEHIGDIYSKCGEIDKAVENWKKAVEKGGEKKILVKKIKKRRYIDE